MGFGSLFRLQIDSLPTRMGYWLVQNYNPRNSTLYLADGTRVSITEEDVQLVLGFLKGDLKIEKWSRAHSTDFLLGQRVQKFFSLVHFFYVDRVVVFTRDIPRQIPSFVGWTAQLIKEREVAEIQAGGFGLGRVENRFKPAAENIQEQAEECNRSVPEPARDDQPSVQPQAPLGSQSLFEEDDEAQTIRSNNQTGGGAQPVIFIREEAANKEATDDVGLGSSAAGLGASASSPISQSEAPTFSVQVGCFSLFAGRAIGASSPIFVICRDEICGGRS
nr:hypothetical protein DM860_012367 [Ipomoea batatas]